MDEISDLLDRAAANARPATFDADALVAATRSARRRRRGLQVTGSSLSAAAVVGLSFGVVHAIAPGHTGSPTGAPPTSTQRPLAPAGTVSVLTTGAPLPTRPIPIPSLPQGFAQACGKPGTKLVVRIIPITIPHRICNLSGVEIVRPGSVTAVVPPRGEGVSVLPAEMAGQTSVPEGLEVTTDKATGDVTIRRP